MKNTIITLTTIGSIAIILDSFNAFSALMYFVIAGQIPGTTIALDGKTMFALCMIPTGFIIGRLCIRAYTFLAQLLLPKQRA